MFPSKSGQPLDSANLRRLVSDVADRAGIGKVTPYDLRHSATSLLSQAGVRNEELADLLGHVDTRMVERHYRHRLDESVTVAAEPMQKLSYPSRLGQAGRRSPAYIRALPRTRQYRLTCGTQGIDLFNSSARTG